MRGAVAAGHPLTMQAGARVLEEGGNAVDACVAAAFASWVAESPLTGPGSGRFCARALGRRPSERLADFFVATPGQGHRAEPGTPRCTRSTSSSAATRRPPRSFGSASRRARSRVRRRGSRRCTAPTGCCPWPELLAPAVELARGGIELTRPAGPSARDSRPDPAAHRRGAPPLQRARRLTARRGRRASASRSRRHARADRPGGRLRPCTGGELARGDRAHRRATEAGT